MTVTWSKDGEETGSVLNPASDFRINAASRIIAKDLGADADDIWWLILIEPETAEGGETALSVNQIYERAKKLDLGDDPSAFLAIPPEYPRELRDASQPTPVTLFARRNYIEAANKRGSQAGIKWLEVGPAFRAGDLVLQEEPFAPRSTEKIEVSDETVVMAVIDSGIAVGHELFRSIDGAGEPDSRVECFWNMDGAAVDTAGLPPDSTEPVITGNAWTRTGLTNRLKANMHGGLLDDPAFYASIGATDWATRWHTPIAQRRSHGTHVMGLCAGYPSNDLATNSEAEKRPIIAVNLRAHDVADPSGGRLLFWLHMAFFYILERYDRFEIKDSGGKKPPLVVNFSFGNFAGPHDPTGLLERAIANGLNAMRARNPNCQFILPAGNGNQSRCHARIELTKDAPTRKLDWRLQPGDQSASAVQIWRDQNGCAQNVQLTIRGPGGLAPVSLTSDSLLDVEFLFGLDDNLVGLAYYASRLSTPFARGFFGIYLFATDHPEDVGPFAPPGVWELELSANPGNQTVGLHAWVERDETLPGFPEFGRQSFFDDPDYARFFEPGVVPAPLDEALIGGPLGYDPLNSSALVRRRGTISGFVGGTNPIVIAGFAKAPKARDSSMALYSSTGLTLNGAEVFPDASARSDRSKVLSGVFSAGSASGSFVALDGTSVSAPQVARLVAGALSKGDPGGPAAVKAIANSQEPISDNPRKPPHIRTGCGRLLDLPNLFGTPG